MKPDLTVLEILVGHTHIYRLSANLKYGWNSLYVVWFRFGSGEGEAAMEINNLCWQEKLDNNKYASDIFTLSIYTISQLGAVESNGLLHFWNNSKSLKKT